MFYFEYLNETLKKTWLKLNDSDALISFKQAISKAQRNNKKLFRKENLAGCCNCGNLKLK